MGVGHPNAPGSRASGSERHMIAIRRILAVVLLTRGDIHLHRWSFGMLQVFSPDVDVVVGHAERQFAPIARNRGLISGGDRKFMQFAITHAHFIELVTLCSYLCHNQRLVVTGPKRPGEEFVPGEQRSFGLSLEITNQILVGSRVMYTDHGQFLPAMRKRQVPVVSTGRVTRKLVTFQSLDVQQERTVARPAVFPVGVGDPFPVGRPTERSSKIVGYVSGNEFAFRPSQGRHNIDAIVVDGQAMKCDLTAVGCHVELIQSDGWLVSRSTVSLPIAFTYKSYPGLPVRLLVPLSQEKAIREPSGDNAVAVSRPG